uniref:Uncharacterized protein n=1 Tax=Knipowitschia caucasica TaxID=637954 RepID=A0AAV2KNJ5_KNICA
MLLTLQNYNLKWRNTPTDDMDCSPAQRLMARRLKSPLPVSDSLLEPRVVADVSEKLRAKHQKAKLWSPDGKMEERCLPPTGGPSVVPGGC